MSLAIDTAQDLEIMTCVIRDMDKAVWCYTIQEKLTRYLEAHKKFYKKSISPILDRREVSEAKILTLDGTIIGNESLLHNII